MKYRLTISAVVVMGLLPIACTSSNTPTQTQTNSNYDQQFREQTRSAAQNYQTGGQLPAAGEDQPITIMLLSMETGNVHPGEDYYVYAVVDKPQNRNDIEYEWSVANGEIREVPESERGRLTTIVESEYATSGTAGPQSAAETGAVGTQGGAEAPPGAAPPSGFQRPGGAAAPGGSAGGFGTGPTVGGSAGTGTPATGGGATGGGGGAGAGTVPSPTNMGPPSGDAGGREKGVKSEGGEEGDGENPASDQEQAEQQEGEPSSGDEAEGAGNEEPDPGKESAFVMERRQVAGPDAAQQSDDEAGTSDENADSESTDSEDQDSEEAEAGSSGRADVSGPAEVAERISQGAASAGAMSGDAVLGGTGDMEPLSAQYTQWKEGEGEFRRQALGPYGNYTETEKVEAEDSFAEFSFITDEPYILWTPRMPGETTIYMKIVYKGEDLTEPTGLDVTVRLKDPDVELSSDFPEIVREDEFVFVKLEGENIPSFNKGLFTLTYDFNKLSFREAELGSFFDDSPDASLYYAQPDKTAGKVLLAIDTNTELINLSGDGDLVFVKFKAKEDIGDMTDTGLTLVSDASARYILDRNGENVLPQPIDYPIFRTAVTTPPALAGFQRENTPGAPVTTGTQPGVQQPGVQAPAAGGQQPAGTGGPGVTQTPAGGGTTAPNLPPPVAPEASGQLSEPIVGPPTPGGISEMNVGGNEDRIVTGAGQGETAPSGAAPERQPVGPSSAQQPAGDREQATFDLLEAISNASPEGIQSALRAGGDPNWINPATGLTALQVAVLDGNRLAVRALLKKAADPNIASAEGKTALDYARENDLTDILADLEVVAGGGTLP